MDKITISLKEARRFIINSQILGDPEKNNIGEIYDIFSHLGYIQIDTISKIQRSHHHVIWTRNKDYNTDMIFELQSKERRIFEYWGHAMSYLPMSDYRFVLPRMENFKNPKSSWVKNHLSKSKDQVKTVLNRIKSEGPLSSKDFESNKTGSNGWWDWKPAKFALEYLFWCGDLMIKERKGFRKLYDLRERVLPEDVRTEMPDMNELSDFLVKKGITAMGIATGSEIAAFMQSSASRDSELLMADKNEMNKSIERLLESREIVEVQISEIKGQKYYSLSNKTDIFEQQEDIKSNIHFLSPFDNLIIGRKRVKEIFNFNYSLECYKPEAKREYGYFVLPILYKNELIGRMDPNADKKQKTLFVNNLLFEEQFKPDEEFSTLLADKLVSFAQFNNCDSITIPGGMQSKTLKKLNSLIKVSFKKTGKNAC